MTHSVRRRYLAWHNTHTPLECPEEWMYPSLPSYHNNDRHAPSLSLSVSLSVSLALSLFLSQSYRNDNSARNTYNCMARVLDSGIANVTKALQAASLWDETVRLHPSIAASTGRLQECLCSTSGMCCRASVCLCVPLCDSVWTISVCRCS